MLEVDDKDPLSVSSWVRARKTQAIVRFAVQAHATEPERISAIGP